MTPSWLTDAWNWIVNNPLFSGAGGTVLAVLLGWMFRKTQNSGQHAIAKKNSTVIQAGRDVKIGDKNAPRK